MNAEFCIHHFSVSVAALSSPRPDNKKLGISSQGYCCIEGAAKILL